jgi:hypothetical protein
MSHSRCGNYFQASLRHFPEIGTHPGESHSAPLQITCSIPQETFKSVRSPPFLFPTWFLLLHIKDPAIRELKFSFSGFRALFQFSGFVLPFPFFHMSLIHPLFPHPKLRSSTKTWNVATLTSGPSCRGGFQPHVMSAFACTPFSPVVPSLESSPVEFFSAPLLSTDGRERDETKHHTSLHFFLLFRSLNSGKWRIKKGRLPNTISILNCRR